MWSTDESFSNTGCEPKDYFLTETYVEFISGVHDRSNGSPSNGSPRTWITMMPQSVRSSLTHTENKSITPNEKGVSVGQSSSSMSDRTGKSHDRTEQPVLETQELNFEH